jgi:hypothetical protein
MLIIAWNLIDFQVIETFSKDKDVMRAAVRVAKVLNFFDILPCDKDSDVLWMSINIVLSFLCSHLFKTFIPIRENGLDVFECRVLSDLCHGFQPSKTIQSYILCSNIPKSQRLQIFRYSKSSGWENIQILHRSFMRSLCSHWKCPCEWKMTTITIYGKIASSHGESQVKSVKQSRLSFKQMVLRQRELETVLSQRNFLRLGTHLFS